MGGTQGDRGVSRLGRLAIAVASLTIVLAGAASAAPAPDGLMKLDQSAASCVIVRVGVPETR